MDERKKRTVFNLLIAHFLLQGMMGSWPTHTHTHGIPSHQPTAPVPRPTRRCDFFLSLFFNDHYNDSDH